MMTFLDMSDDEDFVDLLSDEALEIAAKAEVAGSYTLASCTGLSVCPG